MIFDIFSANSSEHFLFIGVKLYNLQYLCIKMYRGVFSVEDVLPELHLENQQKMDFDRPKLLQTKVYLYIFIFILRYLR